MKSDTRELKFTVNDFYDYYKQERINWSYIPPRKKYIQICKFLLEKASETIITKRLKLKLPHGGGLVLIRKASKKTHEYVRTTPHYKKVYNNHHTLGVVYEWFWDKRKCTNFEMRSFFEWLPVRRSEGRLTGRKGLFKHIIDCNTDPNKPDFKPSY